MFTNEQLLKGFKKARQILAKPGAWKKNSYGFQPGWECPKDDGRYCLIGAVRKGLVKELKLDRDVFSKLVHEEFNIIVPHLKKCIGKHFPRSKYANPEQFNDSSRRKLPEVLKVLDCAIEDLTILSKEKKKRAKKKSSNLASPEL